MGTLPVLKPRQVVALLEAHGFAEVRQRGSHKQFRHPDGRFTTVPFHAGRDISPTPPSQDCS
jgi:predicted RNA binding protein YcfA (HicA-like mRNA interferase family)